MTSAITLHALDVPLHDDTCPGLREDVESALKLVTETPLADDVPLARALNWVGTQSIVGSQGLRLVGDLMLGTVYHKLVSLCYGNLDELMVPQATPFTENNTGYEYRTGSSGRRLVDRNTYKKQTM